MSCFVEPCASDPDSYTVRRLPVCSFPGEREQHAWGPKERPEVPLEPPTGCSQCYIGLEVAQCRVLKSSLSGYLFLVFKCYPESASLEELKGRHRTTVGETQTCPYFYWTFKDLRVKKAKSVFLVISRGRGKSNYLPCGT